MAAAERKVQVVLSDELYQRLEEFKELDGVFSDSEAVRLLIHRRIMEGELRAKMMGEFIQYALDIMRNELKKELFDLTDSDAFNKRIQNSVEKYIDSINQFVEKKDKL